MSSISKNFYAQWRLKNGWISSFHEDSNPPEKLLQVIWFHQRVLREGLKTTDGTPLRVLHPGFWNQEAGPDFRRGVIQFGDDSPQTGDIEIDMIPSAWRFHGHDRNPNYKQVLLHVVWEQAEAKPPLPTLILKPVLDAPVNELAAWLTSEAAGAFPRGLAGQCSAPLRELPEAGLLELLRQAGLVRLYSKAAQMQARARQAGWEQALWEGLFRALGYKHNIWPMQRLAELRRRLLPEQGHPGIVETQARLLGAGGLLPRELTRAQERTDQYLKKLWDCWWRERERFADCQMPRQLWHFGGMRPANHPERRLAVGAHWLVANQLPARLQQWCLNQKKTTEAIQALGIIFQHEKDDFWSWHWTLRGKPLAKPQPLLGSSRLTDLAVNVALPWAWARAREGTNEKLTFNLEERYLEWPAGEDNAVLKLARKRLLGATSEDLFVTAAAQQGLLQIVRDFCEHSDALCSNCRFPDLVRQWQGRA